MSGSSGRAVSTGLLIMRGGLGVMFVLHGWPKLSGGPDTWVKVGGAMSSIGITFAPVFWGFMAAVAECIGGILLAFGLFVRPSAFLLCCTMLVAASMQATAGDDFMMKTSRPIELAAVFLGLLFAGGGDFVLSRLIKPLDGKWYG